MEFTTLKVVLKRDLFPTWLQKMLNMENLLDVPLKTIPEDF
ncbi:hypothetical protein JMUB7507_26540 [Staphylococcus aureus]